MVDVASAARAKYEKKSEPTLEMVGTEHTAAKQKLADIQRLFLPRANVHSAGADLSAACPNVTQLDLEDNPLTSWDVVLDIASQLPNLTWLSLNRVHLPPPPNLADTSTLSNLHTLCLSHSKLDWPQLLAVAASMPQLHELHFSSNRVASLGAADGSLAALFPSLETAFLEDNELADWGAVAPLAQLPRLEVLNLSGNRLRELPSEPAGFGRLRHLMLRANPLESWASIDALDRFPDLKEVRLAELPLTSNLSGMVARRLIIARVGRLAALNGSEVRKREREDAERFYLRQLTTEYPTEGQAVSSEGDGAAPDVPDTEPWRDFEKRHPRWRQLLALHGEQKRSDAGANQAGVLGAELVELTMRATAAEAFHLPAVTRKLPGSLPLKSVKAIACQLFKVDPQRQKLLYSPPGMEKEIPEPLDDDLKRLCDFGVVSGGIIVIEQED